MDAAPGTRWRFDPEYREAVALRDGARVELRLLGAGDGPLVRAVFDRMSDRARYQRFLTPRQSLTGDEVRYFTEIDQVRHLAIVALARADDRAAGLEPDARRAGSSRPPPPWTSRGEPVAIARFVCLPGCRDIAEPAITVVDGWHRRGVGTLLLRRLVLAARERGVASLRASVLASNDAMRALLRRQCRVFRSVFDGVEVVYEIPLGDQDATAA